MSRRLLKGLLTAVLVATTASCALSRVNTRYNRFSDETIVTHRGLDLAPPNPWAGTSLKLQVEYIGVGVLPSRPEKVTVAVISTAKDSPYRDDHKLELIADGDLVESRDAGYDPTSRDGLLVEYMWVKLPTAVFVSMANAREVKGSIGPTGFVLNPEQMAELQDFATNLPPERRKPLLELPFKFPNINL